MVWNGERRTRRNEGGIIYISVLAVVGEDACIRAERSGLVQLISWFMTSRQARKIDSRQKSCVLIDFTSHRIFPNLAIFFFSFSKKGTKSFEQIFHPTKRKLEYSEKQSENEKFKLSSRYWCTNLEESRLKYHTFSMNFEFLNILVRFLSLESNKVTIFHPVRLKMHIKIARNYKKVIRKTTIDWTNLRKIAKVKNPSRRGTREKSTRLVENCFHPIKIRACARAKHDKLSTMQISTVHNKSRNGPLHRRPLVLSVSS